MDAHSTDGTPTSAEDANSPEIRLEVAGWTCLERFAAPLSFDHHVPETGHSNDHDEEERDKEDEGAAIVTPDTTVTTGICEWEGCDQMFKGPESQALLYHHIVNEHVGKPGETKTYDPKCHWAACGYEGKIRRYLLSYIITHVPEYKPLACQDCGWRFQRQSNLRMHQKSCKNK